MASAPTVNRTAAQWWLKKSHLRTVFSTIGIVRNDAFLHVGFAHFVNRFLIFIKSQSLDRNSFTSQLFLQGICDAQTDLESVNQRPRLHWNFCFLRAKVNFNRKPQLDLGVKRSFALIRERSACLNVSPSGNDAKDLPKVVFRSRPLRR